jgi:DNA-binding response OmpR family regulator
MAELLKVLVVEDDKFLSNIYQTKLAAEGYSVVTAANGLEALEVLKNETPNIILLDIIMPKMDGFGFLGERQKDEKLKAIKTVIMSNLGQESDIEQGLALGADDYIVKSDSGIEDVLAKVKEYTQ